MSGMHRAVEVAGIWNWLPVFRVVAETEHLPTAAKVLHITPSALSRTIRLLEAEVGKPLFRRAGRRIELNDTGAELLRHVRDAMRQVHSGLLEARDCAHDGPVHISSGGVLTSAIVQPALERLAVSHPRLIPHLHAVEPRSVVEPLLNGKLDISFLSRSIRHRDLTSYHLGQFTSGVYCGSGHPLYRRRKLPRELILAHPFAAPAPNAAGQTHDGWPGHVDRHVALYADQMDVGVRGCLRGTLLAVLPDPVVEAHGLKRLPFDEFVPAQMYALHRPFLVEGSRAELVLQAVVAHLGT